VKAPSPKKSLGQHFLFDRSLLRKIVEAAGVESGERVLEIGPGPGGLTRALLEAGATVLALEADERMVEHLEELGLERLSVVRADALEVDYLRLTQQSGGPFRLVANLPYNISGPLLARLLRQREAFTSMTVMLQREVAERLLAAPGCRERGRLSVLAQSFCRLRPLLRVPAGAFRPPPKVESTVIRLDVLPASVAPIEDEECLWSSVRMAFGHRRKTLRNALRAAEGDVEGAFLAAGLTGGERPEQLSSVQWIALANALGSAATLPEAGPGREV
jgi:16S rRNA (adenine1518-N6/adenine1519-N6)-dimethyltransferase